MAHRGRGRRGARGRGFEVNNGDGFKLLQLPIFDESSNEDYEGNFKGIPVFDEFPYEDDIVPMLDELSHKMSENDCIVETCDFEDVPIWDKFEEELGNEGLEHVGGNNEEQEMPILVSNEPCLLNWEDSQQVQE
ncbi:hypothetical protein RHMOL_Rhmol10G0168100 [Rhododendron molle]|uniref:Uncharacterized protein n=1 Tax=Rhododendron molle TaxID=49168 RepID=A0ACC0M2Y1_RHOML|nr:hypothetical protein RHMOL_Rhmol10G0168100 [Rhododendron molle]